MSTIARLSIEDYERMAALGAFDGLHHRRIELIRGELREMHSINPPHATLMERLSVWSIQSLAGSAAKSRIQLPIRLSNSGSMPEPDVALVREQDYLEAHPTASEVLLLIEVADSSLEFDCGEKAEIYAAAGIAEYWIVNVPDRWVEVRRSPKGTRYLELKTYQRGEEVSSLALPNAKLDVADLFRGFS